MTNEMIHPARDAATLVIFRDRPGGRAELLMMERAREMEFAGGALVFPGGAVDGDDAVTAERFGGDLAAEEAVMRVAAIRETLEESGLAMGFSHLPEAALLHEMRGRLLEGEPFGGLLAEYRIELDLEQLIPFARWRPNFNHMRIYDTRFYLARLPEGSHEPRVDATENVHLLWADAEDILVRAKSGEFQLIFPTKCNLERLAQFRDFESAKAHARSITITTVTPWVEKREDGDYLCIPDNLGYPVTSLLTNRTSRGLP